jgi:hypothetical protein
MKRASLLLAGLLTAAAAMQAPSVSAFQGQGNNLDCVPSGPSVIVQHGHLTRVGGGDTLHCPAPVNRPGGSFGPHDTRNVSVPRPAPGTPCHFEYQSPVQLRFGGNYLANLLDPVGDPPPRWGGVGFDELVSGLPIDSPLPRIEAFFQDAGTTDYYLPWVFDGTWNANGNCTNPNQQWTSPCTFAINGTFPNCLNAQRRVVAGPQAPVAVLGENLPALVNGRFTGGNVSSLPEAPAHPGLTNLATCFYVSDMTVDGAPADPGQESVWEKVVIGPDDVDEGRHIVYVFRVHVQYRQTTWDFGDGSPALVVQQGGAGSPPGPCTNHSVPNQQFVAAHTYRKYSTGDGFHVTVSHQYGVDVDEYWWDSAGTHHVSFQDAVPPVDVPGAPQPFFVMPVVQEEGVPIGS